MATIAAFNVAAARRQDRLERLVLDRVEVALLAGAGELGRGEFSLAVFVTNRGGPVTIGSPRLVPPAYDVVGGGEELLAAGASTTVDVWVRATCPAASAPALQLAVPMTPESGRRRDLLITVDAGMVGSLAFRACEFDTVEEAAQPEVFDLVSTPSGVTFRLDVLNVSDWPLVVQDLTSPGLALAVRGGVPVSVAGQAREELLVTVALPECSRLPAAGYGTLTLELRDEDGQPGTTEYAPEPGEDDDLRRELLALRERRCPVSVRRGRPGAVRR